MLLSVCDRGVERQAERGACMEVQKEVLMKLIISTCVILVVGLFLRLYNTVVVKPRRLRSKLKEQGVSGPPPKLVVGNILEIKKARDEAVSAMPKIVGKSPLTHNPESLLLPFFQPWIKKYGDVFMFALGNTQILLVTQFDMVREIITCTSLDLGKPSYQAKERGPLLGQGILTSNGHIWAYQKKILGPELYMDKVKSMINSITDATTMFVNSWMKIVHDAKNGVAEIEIDPLIRTFSGDVISRSCFGSDFSKGEKIFITLRALQDAFSKIALSTGIPGMRYLPTKNNRETWALGKEVQRLILEVVRERKDSGHENDFLQTVIDGAQNNSELTSQNAIDNFIVDNCKNIYAASFETTSCSAAWCLMLLAANPEWQDRVRAEVLEICQGHNPDNDMIRKMKLLSMVINETLRLYPPVAIMTRETFKDMKFGNIKVPKEINIWTLATTLHTDPQVWGPDSYEFNPERFANGITGACKHPYLYMPFGFGPRVCLGQHLALVELKILISTILSKFSFILSPKYVHQPVLNLIIEPAYGVHLLVKKL